MATRASILATVNRAFSKGDVIRDGTLLRDTPTYDEDTATTTVVPTTSPCRVLFDRASRTMSLFLTAQVVKPTDKPAWIAKLTFAPQPTDKVTVDGVNYVVVFAEDVVKASAIYFVVLR